MALASIDIEQLTRENARLRMELDRERAARKQAEARADESTARLRAFMGIVHNRTIQSLNEVRSHLANILAEENANQQLKARGIERVDGTAPVFLGTIAKEAGVDRTTHSSNTNKAVKAGVAYKDTKPRQDPVTKEWRTQTALAYVGKDVVEKGNNVATADFSVAARKEDTTPRNSKGTGWGGWNREPKISNLCPSCGSDKTSLKCRDCGKSSRTEMLPEMKAARKAEKAAMRVEAKRQAASADSPESLSQDAACRQKSDHVAAEGFDPDESSEPSPDDIPLDLIYDDRDESWLFD